VVNGKKDYIASDEVSVRTGIKNALAKPATAELSLKSTQVNNKLNVSYTVNGISKNSQLVLAIIQKSAKSNVKRGENAHRILSHYQIVKDLHTIALKSDRNGNTTISVPNEYNTKDYEVIGFVQDINTGAILGAERATNI